MRYRKNDVEDFVLELEFLVERWQSYQASIYNNDPYRQGVFEEEAAKENTLEEAAEELRFRIAKFQNKYQKN